MSQTIVIKIGGVASENLTPEFFEQIQTWQDQGKKIVIVHGGGHSISSMMTRLDIPVTIKDGLRVTTAETLTITQMVLIGQVQPSITHAFQKQAVKAVGLNAADDHLLTAQVINQEKFGLVGQLTAVNTHLIEELLEQKYVPVIAPLGMTASGQWLNINADNAACKIAEALQAERLYLLTDVPGVKHHGAWLKEIDLAEIPTFKKEKIIVGGMIPKLENAALAIKAGVHAVHITNVIQHVGTIIKNCEVKAG